MSSEREALVDAWQQLLYWWWETGRCPCGALKASPLTHGHVPGCPTAAAMERYASSETNLRVAMALDFAVAFGGIDGDHHKAWVIDQMVRALTGCPVVKQHESGFKELGTSVQYEELVKEAKSGEDGPDTYHWNVGIPP